MAFPVLAILKWCNSGGIGAKYCENKFIDFGLLCDCFLIFAGQDGGKRMGLNFDRVK